MTMPHKKYAMCGVCCRYGSENVAAIGRCSMRQGRFLQARSKGSVLSVLDPRGERCKEKRLPIMRRRTFDFTKNETITKLQNKPTNQECEK